MTALNFGRPPEVPQEEWDANWEFFNLLQEFIRYKHRTYRVSQKAHIRAREELQELMARDAVPESVLLCAGWIDLDEYESKQSEAA